MKTLVELAFVSVVFLGAACSGSASEDGLPYMASLAHNPGAVAGVGQWGEIAARDGCVVLLQDDKVLLPVFPPGYHLTTEPGGRVAIRDGEDRDLGSLGQDFRSSLGGAMATGESAGIDRALADVAAPVPETCKHDGVAGWIEIYRPPLWQDIPFPHERVAQTGIAEKALHLASEEGVSDPATAEAVVTTRQQIPYMLGESTGAPGDQVVLAQVWGPFPCGDCDHKARVVWMSADLTSGEVLSSGSGRATELWRVGVPVSLLPIIRADDPILGMWIMKGGTDSHTTFRDDGTYVGWAPGVSPSGTWQVHDGEYRLSRITGASAGTCHLVRSELSCTSEDGSGDYTMVRQDASNQG